MKMHSSCPFLLVYQLFFSSHKGVVVDDWYSRSRKERKLSRTVASVSSKPGGKRCWQICICTCRKSSSKGGKSSHRQTHPHSETPAKTDTPARTIHFGSRQHLQLAFISSAALSDSRAPRHSWMNHLYGLITGSFSPEPTHHRQPYSCRPHYQTGAIFLQPSHL